jgi:hypothetical protein
MVVAATLTASRSMSSALWRSCRDDDGSLSDGLFRGGCRCMGWLGSRPRGATRKRVSRFTGFRSGCERDDGSVLNPSCRGVTGRLVTSGSFPGVEPITGKPSKSTREGKNECLD